MINEWVEFCAYTGTVSYTASKKSDTTWLGRFTFATILEFEGMSRILTVLARGYLFHGKDGAVIWGDLHDRIDYARRALCAWCSVPEDGKRVPDKEWQFRTDFSELHTEFPELVDEDGTGWFLRHVLCVADFMLTHPEKVRSTSLKYAEVIQSKFAAAWRSSEIADIAAVVPHDFQCLIGVGFLDYLCRFYFVNPAHRAFHDVVLIFKPRKVAGQDATDIIYRDLA